MRVGCGRVERAYLETERWIDEHAFTEDDGVPTPEMRPVVLIRQIRFCGLGVVMGGRGCLA